MGLTQMAALTGGRKYKTPDVEEINAQKRYLPAIYGQKKEDAYRDKMYGLEKEGLAFNKEMSLANFALSEEALKEQKKAQKRANRLGYANIGLGAGLGIAGNWDGIKGAGEDVASMFPQIESPASLGIGAPESHGGSTVSGMSSPIDWASSNIFDPISSGIQKFGSAIGDVWDGLYNNIVGDAIDIDWTEGFGADDVIDFGW